MGTAVRCRWKGDGAQTNYPSVCWEITDPALSHIWRFLVYRSHLGVKYELNRWHSSKQPDLFEPTSTVEGESALDEAIRLGLSLDEVSMTLLGLNKAWANQGIEMESEWRRTSTEVDRA